LLRLVPLERERLKIGVQLFIAAANRRQENKRRQRRDANGPVHRSITSL
jgi:hypothetical protein